MAGLITFCEAIIFLLCCNLLVIAPIVYHQIITCCRKQGVVTGLDLSGEGTDAYFNFTSYWGSVPMHATSSLGEAEAEAEAEDAKD